METYKIIIVSFGNLQNESRYLTKLIQEKKYVLELQGIRMDFTNKYIADSIVLSDYMEKGRMMELQEFDICFILSSSTFNEKELTQFDTTRKVPEIQIPRQVHILSKVSTSDKINELSLNKSALFFRYGISYNIFSDENSFRVKCKRILSWIELYCFLINSSCRVRIFNPKTKMLDTTFLYPQRFCIHSLDEVIMLCHKCMLVIEKMGRDYLVDCIRETVLFSDHTENLSEIDTLEALRRFEAFLQGIDLLLYGGKDSNDHQIENLILSTRLSSLLEAKIGSPNPTSLPLVDNKRALYDKDDELLSGLLNTIRLFRNYNIHKKKITPDTIIFYNLGGCLSFDIRQNIALGALLIVEHHFDYLLRVTNTFYIDR